jgi:hypothetical protein
VRYGPITGHQSQDQRVAHPQQAHHDPDRDSHDQAEQELAAQERVPDRPEFGQQPLGVLPGILRDQPHYAFFHSEHVMDQVIGNDEDESRPSQERRHFGSGVGHPLGDVSDPVPRGGQERVLQHGDVGGGRVDRERSDLQRFGGEGLHPVRNGVDEGQRRVQHAGELLLDQQAGAADQGEDDQYQDDIHHQHRDRARYARDSGQRGDDGVEQVGQDDRHDQRGDQHLEPDQEESDHGQDGDHDDQLRIRGPVRGGVQGLVVPFGFRCGPAVFVDAGPACAGF